MSRTSVRRAGGFTLLEVIVALAIAALALVVLFRAGVDGLVAADTGARAEEAVERAQSHLAAVGTGVALLQGESDGDDGDGFRWHLRIVPAEELQVPAASGNGSMTTTLYSVEVSVSWRSWRERSVTLKTFRLGRSAQLR